MKVSCNFFTQSKYQLLGNDDKNLEGKRLELPQDD